MGKELNQENSPIASEVTQFSEGFLKVLASN
jgi:hypothetical protein